MAGIAIALLACAIGSGPLLFSLCMYWLFVSTALAFAFGAAVRALLDEPGMHARSLRVIAQAAEDPRRARTVRRTAVAVYFYMVGVIFCTGAIATILAVGLLSYDR